MKTTNDNLDWLHEQGLVVGWYINSTAVPPTWIADAENSEGVRLSCEAGTLEAAVDGLREKAVAAGTQGCL